jgi:serine/threonine protein kinase/tetratricopeptide (TPR) repeat protein
MGEVYRATDRRLGRTVAIKVLHADANTPATALPLIEREARAVAANNHPHICTLYDVGQQGDVSFLVMEYLEGHTLAQALRAGPLPPATVLSYARQLATALVAAHAKGVIHCDLKPANVFVTTDGILKVLDFGIARAPVVESPQGETRLQTGHGTFSGTVGYSAPEQLRGEVLDPRADLFALGAVLSELLTGRGPFTRSSTAETISAVLMDAPPPLPAHVPVTLAAVIGKCLEKVPSQRFESAAALLAALDSGTGFSLAPAAGPTADFPSIAVLPFADLSPDRDQEYFCDGMADELIAALMTLDGVRVASRTSAFQFKGGGQDVKEIGQRLKVRNVLEGSVRRAGNRLRVTVQLTDVSEGFHLWSQRYDRSLDDVFAVQDEIAQAIVNRLKVELPGSTVGWLVPAANRNVEAYNLYLKGRYSIRKLTKEGFENGMNYFRQALELHPEYAEAHAASAQGYMLLAIFSVTPPRHVMPVAIQQAVRALELNPRLAEGQLSLAWARHWYDWNWIGAEESYRRAVELTPGDSWPRMCYSAFLGLRGRFDEAIAESKRAVELDPVSAIISRGVSDALVMARRFDDAIAHATRAIALEPSFSSMYWSLALAQAGKGSFADAVTTLEEGRRYGQGDATLEGFLGWAYGRAGQREQALAVARELETRRQTAYVNATCLGLVYQGLGDFDTAIGWYRQAYEDRATDCCSYRLAPHFDTMRDDPRFRALIEHIEDGGHAQL